ncbi:uncharacterized protein PSANT_02479 [Moesziomyces antarcticus]|uniref:Uncharacterized protein n=1 Tax=Pseudozyma antarctica TaxID=84753 RepID=A0A5C3FKA3_PSEA2|nr:uncharacterized protein PSANT_02479 [Moesziomyces antarcticus]
MVANTHDGQQPTLRRSNPGHLDMIVVSARYHASCRRAFHLASPSVSDGHVRRRRGSLASMLASPSRFLTQIMRRHAPFFRISVDRALKASGVRIRVDGGACEIVRLRHCDAPSPRRHTPAILRPESPAHGGKLVRLQCGCGVRERMHGGERKLHAAARYQRLQTASPIDLASAQLGAPRVPPTPRLRVRHILSSSALFSSMRSWSRFERARQA